MIKRRHSSLKEILFSQSEPCKQSSRHSERLHGYVFNADFLLQHGAESALVDELSTRLGLALGMDSVESAISSNAIVLTTIKDGQCLTSTRKNQDRGINMHVVTEVQHIVILAEHKLLDIKG